MSQGIFIGKKCRLHIAGFVKHGLFTGFFKKESIQRLLQLLLDDFTAMVQTFPKNRAGLIYPSAHPGILPALPGKQECNFRNILLIYGLLIEPIGPIPFDKRIDLFPNDG